MRQTKSLLAGGFLAGLTLVLAACGPAAEATATSQPAAATATTAAPTATTAAVSTATTGQATATRPAGPTATVAEEKIRPVPVVAAPPPNPNAKKGGIYRSLASDDPINFTIWDSANGNTLFGSVPTTDSLLDRNEFVPKKVEQLLPSLAYDWWTDKSATVWTFKLQQNAKFSDGKPFTCADAEFSLETIRDTRDATGATLTTSPRASWLRRAKDISCPDAYTLQVKTDGPLPSLPVTLAITTFAMLPKHIYEGHLDLMVKEPLKVGVGPFSFDSYRPTESYKLKRNPNYWQQPYPYLDEIHRLNVGSGTAVTSAMSVGRGEAGSLPVTTRIQLEQQGKITVYGKEASDGFLGVEVNRQRTPWNDPRFSQALRCAINGEKVIQTAYGGLGYEGPAAPMPTTPGGSPWSISKEEWKAIGPCHGPASETNMDQRRQMAKDLLAQMGFTASNPAKLKVIWRGDAQKEYWPPIEEDLRAIGLQMTVEYPANTQIYSKFTAGDFDIGTPASYATSRRDPDHWLYEQFYSTSDRMYSKYTNPVTDALIDKQSKTADPVERVKIIREVITALTKENAKIIVNHTYAASPFAAWVMDAYPGAPTNSQNTFAKFQRVWLDPDKQKQLGGS